MSGNPFQTFDSFLPAPLAGILDPVGGLLSGGGGNGGGGGSAQEAQLIAELTRQGRLSGNREQQLFDLISADASRARDNVPNLQGNLAGIAGRIQSEGLDLRAEGNLRNQRELGLLLPQQGVANQIGALGSQTRATGQQASGALSGLAGDFQDQSGIAAQQDIARQLQNQGGLQAQQGVAQQLTGGLDPSEQLNLAAQASGGGRNTTANVGVLNRLSGDARAIGSAQSLFNTQGIEQAGRNVDQLGAAVGGELSGIRDSSLGSISEALQGRVSPEIQQLFTDAGGTREREILELQFQNAEDRIRQGASSSGGSLDRNLAALNVERALGISGQEERRTDQQRGLARELFGIGLNQGLTSPQQQAALRGQAADIFGQGLGINLGAESARQGAVGLSGQLQSQIGQQLLGSEAARQSGIGLGAGILSSVEGQRQAALGQAGGILGNVEAQRQNAFGQAGNLLSGAEAQRQSGLGGALGALDTAFGRDLQGIASQQASLAQQQQLSQALAGQLGAGGDALRSQFSPLLGQAAGLFQGSATAPGIPSNILQGISNSPASSFLAPAAQTAASSNAAAQQAAAQNNAGLFSLLGTGAGIGALALFT